MKKIHFYGAIGVLALLMFLAAITPWIFRRAAAPAAHGGAPVQVSTKISHDDEDAPELSIDEAKAKLGGIPAAGPDIPDKDLTMLSQVYEKYPDATVGNNMVASWARVDPEEKKKVQEQLDKEISQAEDALRSDPADKSAKHALFIASTLKKLCKSNFDYNLLKNVPEEEGGLLQRDKKTARP